MFDNLPFESLMGMVAAFLMTVFVFYFKIKAPVKNGMIEASASQDLH